jgi:hypothetical protein
MDEEVRNISDASSHDISLEIIKSCDQDFFTVFPIGFGIAGKTMLLSSIFSFAEKNATKPFTVTHYRHYPFNNGFKLSSKMISEFDINNGQLMGRNAMGNIDLFGLTLKPKNTHLDDLNLNFVDVSGEDISKIKSTQDAKLTPKIKAIFDALELKKSPTIFLLVTPFTSVENRGDADEDALHANFIDFLSTDYPTLFKLSRLFIVVTKWDQNKDNKLTVEKFIKENRSSLYSKIMGTNAVYGMYSIGKILETTEGNETRSTLVEINQEYPFRLWNKVYEIFSGRELTHKKWWQRIFS